PRRWGTRTPSGCPAWRRRPSRSREAWPRWPPAAPPDPPPPSASAIPRRTPRPPPASPRRSRWGCATRTRRSAPAPLASHVEEHGCLPALGHLSDRELVVGGGL